MKITVTFEHEDEFHDFLDWREAAQREREKIAAACAPSSGGGFLTLPDLQAPIEDAEFSIRTRNVLTNMGCKTIGDISRFSAAELKKISGFGAKSMREVKDYLKLYGLRLKP